MSPDVCESYGFDSSKGECNLTHAHVEISLTCCFALTGFFLFFIFFAFAMLVFQLAFEAAAIAYHIRMQSKLRRLRYRAGGFVELPPVTEKEFAHLPGLDPSPCYHLFLSHAWPLGQDVCKLIKQRCREMCPSLHVFLDVEDLASGYGAEIVDKSRSILIFAMPVFFDKINCVRELVRAVVRNKQVTLLLPDAEVHGVVTQETIRGIVKDQWVEQWKLEKTMLADWAADWKVTELKVPTAVDICDALFKQPPLEWSRITAFQDRTMVLMCQRLLPEAERRGIYLQGSASFKLPRKHVAIRVYCSPHNLGARELADELNGFWPGLLQVRSDLSACDHMLVYLNALTWMHEPEEFAAELRRAMCVGLPLQTCHEFTSSIDLGSRHALEFSKIMNATPADLRKEPTNIYSQIAIPLKGGELREPGLAILAVRLAKRVPFAPLKGAEPSQRSRSIHGSFRWPSGKTAAAFPTHDDVAMASVESSV